MKRELERAIAAAIKGLFSVELDVELTRPEEKFGDYATNVALQLAQKVGKPPREIAEQLAGKLREDLIGQVSDVSVAGPGFLNLKLSDKALIQALKVEPGKTLADQEILVEFGDPNPFKEMHIGHLYSYVVGDSIANLLEGQGAKVHRLSYHGDVGLHVAKAIWGMQQSDIDWNDTASLQIGSYYAQGAKAYEGNESAKNEIQGINEHVYKKDDPKINDLYAKGREVSLSYFDGVLKSLGIKTDKRFFESETAELGEKTVRAHIGRVFKESEGATIYEGEKVGLHTRVFITSKGLPTYETKDLGLAELKRHNFPNASRSIIITANEQSEYFKVMLAALAEFDKQLADSITHLSHGFVSLSTGKMSSRTGEVYGAIDLQGDVEHSAKKLYPETTKEVLGGAIKYEFLKHRLGSNIVYDISESVSLEGNSGPYLQYAHARARSILKKTGDVISTAEESNKISQQARDDKLDSGERSLARKISEYPEVVDKATDELMPHHICTYLYELAQAFNRFYEHNRVIGDERQAVRLELVKYYADTLKKGLGLLGIAAPDHL